jgi:hypothetical protein
VPLSPLLAARRATPSSSNVPATPPDIGISADSDLDSLMPYPAWCVSFGDGGGRPPAQDSQSAVPERISANLAGCDLFNVAEEELPYLVIPPVLLWLHPDDTAARATAATAVLRAQCRYYEWTGRYVRTVPCADRSRGDGSPPCRFHLFFAVERIFCSYHASGAVKRCLSIFSMVQDGNEEIPAAVIARFFNSPPHSETRVRRPSAPPMQPNLAASAASSIALGPALTSFGARGGSFTEQQQQQQQQALRQREGSDLRPCEGSDLRDPLFREALLFPPAPSSGTQQQWASYQAPSSISGFQSSDSGGSGAAAATGASGYGGRYSFSEVLRGLSGDWSPEHGSGAPADAGAPLSSNSSSHRDSFFFGLGGLGPSDDSSIVLQHSAWGGHGGAAAPPLAASATHATRHRRSSSGTALSTALPVGQRSSFSGVGGGGDSMFTASGLVASAPLRSSIAATTGFVPPEGQQSLQHAVSWATDLATRAALAAAGGDASPPDRGARRISGLGGGGGGAQAGQMWEGDSNDSQYHRRLSRSSAGSADFTYGFTSLELGPATIAGSGVGDGSPGIGGPGSSSVSDASITTSASGTRV